MVSDSEEAPEPAGASQQAPSPQQHPQPQPRAQAQAGAKKGKLRKAAAAGEADEQEEQGRSRKRQKRSASKTPELADAALQPADRQPQVYSRIDCMWVLLIPPLLCGPPGVLPGFLAKIHAERYSLLLLDCMWSLCDHPLLIEGFAGSGFEDMFVWSFPKYFA